MPVINTHQNIAAFLDMLAVSEGTANHPLTKNRGYDVIVIRASPEQASMEFYGGKSPKIASVHQFGLSEENRKDGKKIDYPARPLLGFTGEDVQMIEEIILAHLER